MTKKLIFLFSALSLSVFFACQSDNLEELYVGYSAEEIAILNQELNLPDSPASYAVGNVNVQDAVDHKGTLGRVLFYDKNLSQDGSVACASCHQQSKAFADDVAFSHGVNNKLTDRNSIALGSLRNFGAHYQTKNSGKSAPGLFWDERAATIKEQIKQTINNPNEMGMSLDKISEYVNASEIYQVLGKKAYGKVSMGEDEILEALEVFVSNSCHGNSLNLAKQEAGLIITTANNGLTLTDDEGMYEHTYEVADKGKFKIPGLRNISLTAPYMHDGRFSTLEEVVEFYNSEVTMSDNLHPLLVKDGVPKKLNLTEEDKDHLIGFLESLTGTSLLDEEKWSNPYK